MILLDVLCWIAVLIIAFFAGKVVSRLKLPAILGWLIAGMLLGPNAVGLLHQELLSASGYKLVITCMQSLGTFALVSLAFGIVFLCAGIPVYLAFIFGGIALATAPAPALSIVSEFHTRGPVTNTLLPMAVLDDIVGIAVFFTVNSFVARKVSGGAVSLIMIPVMIFLPVLVGAVTGFAAGKLLERTDKKRNILLILLAGISVTVALGFWLNTKVFTSITLNYMLMGVAFSAVFSNMLPEKKLEAVTEYFHPILGLCLLGAIVDLGAPLDYHLIVGAGFYTFLYIGFRACGKYFGARMGAKLMKMPETVRKYLGFTLLPHSGVSLVFTGIVCSVLEGPEPEYAVIVKGTIAAAAVINEIIAVIAAKKGFELAGEIPVCSD